MKTITLSRNSIHRSLWRSGLLLIPLLLGCFALLPRAQAVGPDTDGSIPGANNGDGVGVLVSRTSGVWNTGTGFEALNHLTGGKNNTATGLRALFSNISGSYNTATGVYALYSNTTGWYNNAVGAYALAHNTANWNTANGYGALYSNTTGVANTATGFGALYRNTTGTVNVANGPQALLSNTTGNENTAVGTNALASNTTGSANTAIGLQALFNNPTGNNNTAVGASAGGGGNNNTAVGAHAGAGLGNNNTTLGNFVGSGLSTANNVIVIGANVSGENVSDTCYIGNIFGVTSAGATAVYVNSLGKLGTVVSSQRFKDEIKPMGKASEAILALKPVTFRYKQEIDPARSPQFGLVAEDVEKVNPDLVVRDAEGKVNTVRYEAVNAMLLNEFLKEHRKMEAQEATITQLKSTVAQQQRDFQATVAHQQKQIEALTAGLQKVSAQVEMRRPSPQTVLNNQ
jgi:uncharacterized coiled-coil protein SlyX